MPVTTLTWVHPGVEEHSGSGADLSQLVVKELDQAHPDIVAPTIDLPGTGPRRRGGITYVGRHDDLDAAVRTRRRSTSEGDP